MTLVFTTAKRDKRGVIVEDWLQTVSATIVGGGIAILGQFLVAKRQSNRELKIEQGLARGAARMLRDDFYEMGRLVEASLERGHWWSLEEDVVQGPNREDRKQLAIHIASWNDWQPVVSADRYMRITKRHHERLAEPEQELDDLSHHNLCKLLQNLNSGRRKLAAYEGKDSDDIGPPNLCTDLAKLGESPRVFWPEENPAEPNSNG